MGLAAGLCDIGRTLEGEYGLFEMKEVNLGNNSGAGREEMKRDCMVGLGKPGAGRGNALLWRGSRRGKVPSSS